MQFIILIFYKDINSAPVRNKNGIVLEPLNQSRNIHIEIKETSVECSSGQNSKSKKSKIFMKKKSKIKRS